MALFGEQLDFYHLRSNAHEAKIIVDSKKKVVGKITLYYKSQFKILKERRRNKQAQDYDFGNLVFNDS